MTSHVTTAAQPDDSLRRLAAATLGWPIANPARFDRNVRSYGLGDALNLEHEYID